MYAATFLGDGAIRIDEKSAAPAAPGEVTIDVLACALCGSELRVFKQGWPVTPGHEIVGRVNHAGHALHGRRVLVYMPIWCGSCAMCEAGHEHLCTADLGLVGWQRDGGYAERVNVPEQCLIEVPDDVPTHLAPLLLDTIATAGHGIRMARRVADSGHVLVIGAGPIGLGTVLTAQAMGLSDIHVAEIKPKRRALAERFGAEAIADDVTGLTHRDRFPMVFETTGSHAGRQRALELTAPMGVCVFLGESNTWEITENKPIRRKDFFIARSFYFPRSEFSANVDLLRSDMGRYAQLVDAQVPLSGLNELFAAFALGDRIKPQCSFADRL